MRKNLTKLFCAALFVTGSLALSYRFYNANIVKDPVNGKDSEIQKDAYRKLGAFAQPAFEGIRTAHSDLLMNDYWRLSSAKISDFDFPNQLFDAVEKSITDKESNYLLTKYPDATIGLTDLLAGTLKRCAGQPIEEYKRLNSLTGPLELDAKSIPMFAGEMEKMNERFVIQRDLSTYFDRLYVHQQEENNGDSQFTHWSDDQKGIKITLTETSELDPSPSLLTDDRWTDEDRKRFIGQLSFGSLVFRNSSEPPEDTEKTLWAFCAVVVTNKDADMFPCLITCKFDRRTGTWKLKKFSRQVSPYLGNVTTLVF